MTINNENLFEFPSSREALLRKIDFYNNKIKLLKGQGETNNKTLSRARYKRNLYIKKLIKDLAPEIDYYNLINEVREK